MSLAKSRANFSNILASPAKLRTFPRYLPVVFGIASMAFGSAALAQTPGSLPATPPIPADNPQTPAKIALGKQLYFDPRLSLSGTLSCNTCHNVMSNGTDNLPLSFGVFGKVDVPRNTPTVFNAAFNTIQFWDGRADSLEAQAKGPITNPVEMGMPDGAAVVGRLKQIPDYQKAFAAVFGGADPVTFDNTAAAIAAYERTLITPDSPYDLYVKGNKTALNTMAIAGMALFKSMNCASCHAGPMFDNPGLPMGTGFYQKFPMHLQNPECLTLEQKYKFTADLGRYNITHNEADRNSFRVPGLRNVALTAPYFHNGSVQTLPEAVRVMAACQLNKDISDQQVTAITAYLDALTGKIPQQTMPHLPQTANGTILMDVPQLAAANAQKK
jgi:cytochrome c peroxidase